jgi:antitoxin MazE
METVIKTRIVKIGNSQGVRIPKLLLDQLGFGTEVEITVQQNNLVIRPLRHPREGWEEQFRQMAAHGDDQLLDGDIVSLSSWDDAEWEW